MPWGLPLDIIKEDDRLQELDQGEWVGRVREEIYTDEVRAEMEALDVDFKASGGTSTSMRETGGHMFAALEDIADGGVEQETPEDVLVFGHGVAIRCLVGHIRGWGREQIYKAKTPNTSETLVTRRKGLWAVEYIGAMPN
ncbi:MAG: histidine phosphatase family protein [Candidatus Saccharimonadales bacterium]